MRAVACCIAAAALLHLIFRLVDQCMRLQKREPAAGWVNVHVATEGAGWVEGWLR